MAIFFPKERGTMFQGAMSWQVQQSTKQKQPRKVCSCQDREWHLESSHWKCVWDMEEKVCKIKVMLRTAKTYPQQKII